MLGNQDPGLSDAWHADQKHTDQKLETFIIELATRLHALCLDEEPACALLDFIQGPNICSEGFPILAQIELLRFAQAIERGKDTMVVQMQISH